MDYVSQLERGRFGALELKHQIGPNLLKGLVVSLLVHGSVFASPFIYRLLAGPGEVPERPPIVIVLEPPPLLPASERPARPTLDPPLITAPPKAVNPIPVDSEPQEPDAPMVPDQGDFRHFPTPLPGDEDGDGSGPVVIYEPPEIEGEIPRPEDFVAFEVPPQALTDNPQPEFPELAKTVGMSGKVVVQVFVDKAGRVKRWEVVKAEPAGLGFEDEVLKIIDKWRFTPAIQSGNPVGVWVAVPFRFELKR